MLPQNNLGSETNIKLPFFFIFFSFITLVVSQIILLSNGAMMTNGTFRIPALWSGAHLLILGWALMIAMGSMYQLVPVAFLTKIWNEPFGFVQFFITAAGILLFTGTLYWAPQKAFLPGILMLFGILMFLFQMIMTLRNQAKPTIMTAFVGTALFALLVTLSLGITLLYCLTSGAGAEYYQAIFQTHLLMGIAGWFTLLIFGFSYKMAPMFSLSHGFPMIHARYVYGFYTAGLVITAGSFFTGNARLTKLGFFLLLLGFSIFNWHISIIINKRLKKNLDKPFRFALAAIIFGNLIHLVAFILLWTDSFGSFIGSLIYSYLLLWIVLSILGYLYKIVPFLWWTHKYSQKMGREQVPTLKQMMNEKLAEPLFIIYIVSVIAVFIALVFKNVLLFNIGQLLVSVTFIIMTTSILMVVRK